VLASPALRTRTRVSLWDKARIVGTVLARRPLQLPVPLDPEDFSELEPFVAFVRDDPLALREVPARLLYDLWRARGRLRRAARALRAPLLVAMAGDDPVCDNPRTRRLLRSVRSPTEYREYAGARHILEFSTRADDFLDDLAAWLQRVEPG